MNAAAELLAGRSGPAVEVGGRAWTFEELRRDAAKFANALRNLGVHRRDRVWLWAPPSIWHVVAPLGTILAGAVFGTLRGDAPALPTSRSLLTMAARKTYVDEHRDPVEMWHVVLIDDAPARMSGGDFRWMDYFEPASPVFTPVDAALERPEGIAVPLAGSPADLPPDDPMFLSRTLAPAWRAGRIISI